MAITQSLIDQIKEKILQKISHTYLFQHIQKPVIDDERLLLILSILKEAKLSDKDIEKYTITTMLIQIALDTHELITNESQSKDLEKNRQLTVLAGDFYSGHYFQLLAEAEDIHMIKILAEAIKEINEQKIALYQKAAANIDELVKSIVIVEYALVDKLIAAFHMEAWKNLSSFLLLIKRLLKEKNTYNETGSSLVIDNFASEKWKEKKKTGSSSELILGKCLEEACSRLQKAMKSAPICINNLLLEKIQLLLNECQQQQMYVEEG
ncbi:heptaprenyl diphosphate synthase component 1 [Niallia sp. NCCP-28]|uniref:heptaprenyl diphosphate synthase component 1 n=1 Tax=Niallia sp. NCCP-28 TaxID=2934712 RepID=UPI00208481FF|nr:heptaprenyl diphosphate synthase component 1 [Niallia sp. NCCP-28]GKU81009.1 hypothetical protein NCCP28_04050 [Niallia sp. NCCP-28]